MRIRIALFFLFSSYCKLVCATQLADTTSRLDEVVVNAYFTRQPLLELPASVSVIGAQQLHEQQHYSFLPALNSVPGVRMEERSPGSYRLSIRGSLLRSPFGVRNVKMYLDDFLLTDAGGNTYFQALDASGMQGLEILKGPEASVFGANTGGVILIDPHGRLSDSLQIKAGLTGGSFGLFHQYASFRKAWQNISVDISQGYQRSDGYRENSALDRKYVHIVPRWQYSDAGQLRALLMYSDLEYGTPGGLNADQYQENPRQARPATSLTPGALEQRAGIMNKSILAGLSHEHAFSRRFFHVVALTASHTDFKNPFITNYETRDESSIGLRTYFEVKSNQEAAIPWRWQLGYEGQQTNSDIWNYGNRGGVRDTVQKADQLTARQQFAFLHFSSHITPRLLFEAAASFNFYKYTYRNLQPVPSPTGTRIFKDQLMPRVALSYKLSNGIVWRASASRGYSPPTIAEIRSSDNRINTMLEAETGWNYETGFRLSFFNSRFYWDGVLFNYRLEDAIVRRLNEDGNEFFINAGGTRQTGVESQLEYHFIPKPGSGFIRGGLIRNSYTYSAFRFRNYQDAENNYSGNRLTGVPKHVFVTSLKLQFPYFTELAIQHNYTSDIPLNDAGSVYADAYHLVQVKASHTIKRKGRSFTIFALADNLLNEEYSLGNDLNAGNRYFNPAPGRNFSGGIHVDF